MRLNARTLFVSLVITAVLAAFFGILQLWLHSFSWEIFAKIMGTLLVVGVISSFLMAVDYDLGSTTSRRYLFTLVGLSLSASVLVIAQIWMDLMPWDTFKNVMITYVILAGLVGFLLVAKDDFTRNKKLRDENYID